jgi:hypothetical protein
MGRGQLAIVGIVTLAVLGLVGGFFVSTRLQSGYDPGFDTSVASPAFTDQRPIALFDEGHNNAHTIAADYRPLARMLRADGYVVQSSDGEIAAESLRSVTVLVIAGARGDDGAEGEPAFSDAEASAISEWVLRGGALLLVTDLGAPGLASASLAERFGVEMDGVPTEDPAHADPVLGSNHIIFARADASLPDHAITRGRNANESVAHVLTFSGQSLRGPFDAVSLLTLSSHARDASPTAPENRRDESEPVSAAGRSQAVAVNFGRGRVVVLGDAAMLRAFRDENGEPIGMNRPGYDNRQFALNIMHWLSRLI